MNIIKHEVKTYVNGSLFRKDFYKTKEQALERTRYDDGYSKKVYSGTVEVELYCESCDKDLNVGDKYIKADDYTRYCSDCYEENTFKYYTVGGEEVANENDAELYDEDDVEVLE